MDFRIADTLTDTSLAQAALWRICDAIRLTKICCALSGIGL